MNLTEIDLLESERRRVRDILDERTAASYLVGKALAESFGRDAEEDLHVEATVVVEKAIAQAPVTYGPYFEIATVLISPPIRLKRDEGDWSVVADDFAKDFHALAQISEGTRKLKEFADQITSGKFASSQEAVGTIGEAMRTGGWRVLVPEQTTPPPSAKPSR